MDEKILKLTNAVYKILEYFPESDPMKNRAKEKALAIMEGLNLSGTTGREKIKILEEVDILLGYLWMGKSQGWLNSANFLIISNEYEALVRGLGVGPELNQNSPQPVLINENTGTKESPHSFNSRQKKILEFLSKNEKAQVMDLQGILPDVTKRTIRRDLDELLEAGKIARFGEFNQIFYRINS